MARKRSKGIESTGQDRRSADELKSEIDKLTGDEPVQAPEQAETPGPPEPAVQPTEPEPGQIDIDKLEEDLDTGLKLIHPDKPEPAPEEDKPVAPETPPAPEPELPEEVRAHGFKSVEDVYKSYNEIRRVADSERDKGRTRDEELAKIKEELAFLRGQAATSPQVAPPQPQVTKEQLDEAYQNDPIGTTNWLLQQQEARAEARINALQEKMREEQNARAIEDRQRFAVTQIPELRALHEVGGDPAKADPEHILFANRLTTVLKDMPELGSSNDRLQEAAKYVRGVILYEKAQQRKPSAGKPTQAPAAPAGDVFVEGTEGRSAASPSAPTKAVKDMTTDELKRILPRLDRDG